MLSITAIFFTAAILPSLGFFHEQTMITKTPPGSLKKDAFFGYALTSDEKSLLISAPAADQIGKIFEFNLEDNSSAKEIEVTWDVTSDPYAEYDWLGATMKTYGPRRFVICAPRKIRPLVNAAGHIIHHTNKMPKVRCYILSLQNHGKWRDLSNIDWSDKEFFNNCIVSFGWSADVDEHRDIWISSPVLWMNSIIIYEKTTMFKKTKFLATDHLKEDKDFVNLGYSIVSGNFLSETGNDHAVSYTYGNNGNGEVLIFENRENTIRLSSKLLGDSVGSIYGAVLCKARLGHKRASLLVGAPTYVTSLDGYDRGAVYLYVPDDSAEKFTLHRVIKGEKDAGYFGHAIASLGDMDGDQKDEVAIGAPFEDGGKGAVYIFSGDSLLNNRSWSQRIQSAGNSFGFSLLPLPDYFHGLNGLSVGAPFEDRVYVITPIPAITVKVDTILPNSQVTRKNLNYVDFTIVTDVTYPDSTKDIIAKFDVILQIEHPNATLEHEFSDGSETYTLLFNSTIKSDKRTLKILTPPNGKYHVPISYTISVKFSNEDSKRNPLMLSERSNVLKRGELWVSDCKAQFHCVPDLSVDFQTDISNPYTVGSSEKSNFSLVIRNTGETAYSPCAVVSVRAVRVLRPAPGCALDTLRLVCRPTHPLPHNGEWNITNIELEMDALTSKTTDVDSIDIMYDVYNDCDNKQGKKSYNKTFGLRYDTGINIIGISIPSEPVDITSTDLRNVIRMQHKYTIMNKGVVNWSAVACDILLPKTQYIQYPNDVMIQRGSDKITCAIEDEESSKDILTAACNCGDLHKNGITEVFIDVEVLPNLIGKSLQHENFTVNSELKLKLFKDDSTSKNITTTLVLNTAAVPVWVIVLSVLVGLLILLLIGLILYKYNCLERKNKKKLEDLKTQKNSTRGDAIDDQDGNYKTLEEDEDIVVVEATVAPDVAPSVEAVEHSVDNRIDHIVKAELINN